MLFHPAQLGLEADKKACKKIGPCGVGKKALYLNSFYIDRRYYLPYGSISRVFKRVAMSQGGFSGKGMFASMAYLVVEYDGGKQKQETQRKARNPPTHSDRSLPCAARHVLLSGAGRLQAQSEAEALARRCSGTPAMPRSPFRNPMPFPTVCRTPARLSPPFPV